MMMLRERMGASLVYFVCEVFFWEIIFNVYKYITYIFMCIHHDDAPRARGRVCTWTYHVYVCTYIIMMLERVGMSLATIQMQEVHACDMTHSYMAWIISLMWHDASACVTWLIHLFVHSMTDLSVWSDTLICVTWLIHVWHDSLICVTWLIHMCDWVHSCVQRDSFTFDMPHSHMWLDAFICVTWLIYTRDVTAVEAGTCSGCHITHMNQSCHTYECVIVLSRVASVTWLIHLCNMTY